MLRIVLLCQLIFFTAFGISYGDMKRREYEKGIEQGFIDATEYMSLDQLQNIKITES